jgi:hypothetical protein
MVGAGLRHVDDIGAEMQVDPLVLIISAISPRASPSKPRRICAPR